jgi:hypothetical protein
MAYYFTSFFSIPADGAPKASTFKNLTRIKFPKQPDSVISFLKDIGLSDSQIRRVTSFDPNLLSKNVDKFLHPRDQALMDVGFTVEILSRLIQSRANNWRLVTQSDFNSS